MGVRSRRGMTGGRREVQHICLVSGVNRRGRTVQERVGTQEGSDYQDGSV